VNLAH